MLRTFATLALAAGLGGCATPYNVGIPVADGGTVALLPGESASLPDGLLRYVRLVGDSRCPPDVQCVWAGDAEIQVRWQAAGGRAQDAALHTSPLQGRQTAVTFGPHRVSLDALARGIAPQATLRITPAGD